MTSNASAWRHVTAVLGSGTQAFPRNRKPISWAGSEAKDQRTFVPLDMTATHASLANHIAEGGCLNACLRVVGESKDGCECKLGAGAHESPKRHFRDQEGRGEVVRLGFNSVFRRLKWLQRIVNLAPNDQFPVLFDEIMAQLVTDRKTDSARRQTRARGRMEQNENALVPMKLDAPMKLRRVLAIECLPRDKRGRNRPATRACI